MILLAQHSIISHKYNWKLIPQYLRGRRKDRTENPRGGRRFFGAEQLVRQWRRGTCLLSSFHFSLSLEAAVSWKTETLLCFYWISLSLSPPRNKQGEIRMKYKLYCIFKAPPPSTEINNWKTLNNKNKKAFAYSQLKISKPTREDRRGVRNETVARHTNL